MGCVGRASLEVAVSGIRGGWGVVSGSCRVLFRSEAGGNVGRMDGTFKVSGGGATTTGLLAMLLLLLLFEVTTIDADTEGDGAAGC